MAANVATIELQKGEQTLKVAQEDLWCTKNSTNSFLHPAQSITPSMEGGASCIVYVVIDLSKKINLVFILCTKKKSSLKTTIFLAFQIVHIKHKGPTCHTFLHCLPMAIPFQLKRVSNTDLGLTHTTPKENFCLATMKE